MTTNLTPDEQDLHDFMERSLSGVRGDTQLMEARSVARGRTLRLRRRVGTGLAGAAVLGAVAALVLPATMGGSSDGRSSQVATDPTTDPGPSTDPGPVNLPAVTGWWDIPAGEIHDRLLPLLPGSVTIDNYELAPVDRAPGETGTVQGWLNATLTTSSGLTGGLDFLMYPPTVDPAALDPDLDPDTGTATGAPSAGAPNEADVSGGEPANEQRIACPANPGPARTCTPILNSQGDRIGRLSTWSQTGIVIREAVLLRDQGGVIYVAAANSTDAKWGTDSTVSADAPPLTLAELRVIAESDTWTDWTPPTH
ncbi:hypothetical protein [Nocardioides sp.]|jgi:hypothetical protein|uniref:hypothetical protein n=1 Tax=Nocardioides sp. TaxID=35761 RepID=UPI0031FF0295|nr:hypothetical protein [Nocardioides sp.]